MSALESVEVSKKYPDGTVALHDVSIEVPSGSIFAMLGENGAGKTTFLSIASTILRQTGGIMKVLGHDALTEANKVKGMIALVPQEADPMGFMTPEEFVMLYLVSRGLDRMSAYQASSEALQDLGLSDQKKKIIDTLSGGLRRRVLLAAALASDAQLIMLDEPTRGLDPIARRTFWSKLFLKKSQGRTIILNTHYPDEAEAIGDSVAILHKGRVAFRGSIESARKDIGFSHKITLERDMSSFEKVMAFFRSANFKGKIMADESFVTVLTSEQEAKELAQGAVDRGGSVRVMPSNLEDLFLMKVRS